MASTARIGAAVEEREVMIASEGLATHPNAQREGKSILIVGAIPLDVPRHPR
jgi:hypothetical protein